MLPLQDVKYVNLIADMTVDNASFAVSELDTIGYSHCTIVVGFGNVPANTSALKVTESDTAGSGHADVTGLVVGTSTNTDGTTSTLPTAAAGDGDLVVFEIDLRDRKRYLDMTITAGNGSGTVTECFALAILSNPQVSPVTASARGAADILRV